MKLKTFFGLVTVSLTAPKNLLHPLIVAFDPERKKSIASLRADDLKNVSITTIELKEALNVGYKLVTVHRYDQYTRSPSLWGDMILKFYVEKLVNSKDILSVAEYEKFYHSVANLSTEEKTKKTAVILLSKSKS